MTFLLPPGIKGLKYQTTNISTSNKTERGIKVSRLLMILYLKDKGLLIGKYGQRLSNYRVFPHFRNLLGFSSTPIHSLQNIGIQIKKMFYCCIKYQFQRAMLSEHLFVSTSLHFHILFKIYYELTISSCVTSHFVITVTPCNTWRTL